MDENAKNKLIWILILFSILLIIVSLRSCAISRKTKEARDREIAARLDLEEKASKIEQQKANLEKKSANLAKELEQEKSAHETADQSLGDEKSANDKLRDELEKLTRLKNQLEEDLKEALVNNQNKAKTKK